MTFTRVRDSLFLAVGLSGLIYQQVTQNYNAVLVGAWLTLLGFPGVAGIVTLVRNGGQLSPSPHPQSPSLSGSPISSSTEGGGDRERDASGATGPQGP